MQSENPLKFRWQKRGERYLFRCDLEVHGNPEQYNDHLADVLRWCKAQKLRPDDYRFLATRTSLSEKSEVFEVEGKRAGFSGSTVFHPTKLKVELELPDSLGVMFTMAFPVSDERA